MKAVILENQFTESMIREGRENLLTIANHSLSEWLERAAKAAGLDLVRPSEVTGDEPAVLFLSAGFPFPEKETLRGYLDEDGIAIRDENDELVAFTWSREDGTEILSELKNKEVIFEDLAKLIKEPGEERPYFTMDLPHIIGFSELTQVAFWMHEAINDAFMENGVRIDQPFDTIIDPDAEIGRGTWIQGRVQILGKTVIGEDCRITDGSYLEDSTIGKGVVIKSSVIESSVMEEGSNIGPFSHLRPQAHLGKNVHVGNFVELKKASMGEGSKAGHLAYIGDAEVGRDVNISCGVIFCNYDGKKKHLTKVGDGAFLGSNANLVAPVEVEKEGFVAAGSTITKKVPEGTLVVERSEQKQIPGYVAKRKEKGTL